MQQNLRSVAASYLAYNICNLYCALWLFIFQMYKCLYTLHHKIRDSKIGFLKAVNLLPSTTCHSGPASLSGDVGLKWILNVLLNVIHCLFRSAADPMQPHTCTQQGNVGCYLHVSNFRGDSGRKRKSMGRPFQGTDYRWHKSARTH